MSEAVEEILQEIGQVYGRLKVVQYAEYKNEIKCGGHGNSNK